MALLESMGGERAEGSGAGGFRGVAGGFPPFRGTRQQQLTAGSSWDGASFDSSQLGNNLVGNNLVGNNRFGYLCQRWNLKSDKTSCGRVKQTTIHGETIIWKKNIWWNYFSAICPFGKRRQICETWKSQVVKKQRAVQYEHHMKVITMWQILSHTEVHLILWVFSPKRGFVIVIFDLLLVIKVSNSPGKQFNVGWAIFSKAFVIRRRCRIEHSFVLQCYPMCVC